MILPKGVLRKLHGTPARKKEKGTRGKIGKNCLSKSKQISVKNTKWEKRIQEEKGRIGGASERGLPKKRCFGLNA